MLDIFKDRLGAVDDVLLQALKALFEEEIEKTKPRVDEINDNALLGEKYRAYEKAKEIIALTFIDLVSYKQNQRSENKLNKER